ncbi:MAG: tripartite tricarboxylate transporter substrate binding protein [Pseudomonadota bacterium]
MPRIAFLVSFLATLLTANIGVASADSTYPTRPISLIVPFAAGGSVDVVARLVAEQLRDNIGQPVVVENVTGAGGTIGATRVSRATPDGYTILIGNLGTQIASTAVFKTLPYNPLTDFVPVMTVAYSPEILLVNKDSPVNSLNDLIALAKSKTSPLTIGHAGIGSISHLAFLLFKKQSNINASQVPYRGDIEADRDVMGNRIDAVFNWTSLAAPFVKSNQMKAVVLLSPKRTPILPNVPTSTEAGMPHLVVNAWTGLFFPKGTPQPIVAKVNETLQKAFANEAFVKKMNDIGLDAPPADERSPQALQQLVKSEYEKWIPLIHEAQ